MRLFIGISFKENILVELIKVSNRLQENSIKGNFTYKENLHLTLAFLGEVDSDRVYEIEKVMKSIEIAPFIIRLSQLGNFKRSRGNIYWIGVKESVELCKLYEDLSNKLRNCGFAFENRPYTPHLTIGRNVRIKEDLDINDFSKHIDNLIAKVDKISLMQSHRVDDKLTYTPLIEHFL